MRYCMVQYFTGYQNYDKSKLKVQLLLSKIRRFQLWPVVFLISLKAQGHTEPQLKALRYGVYETRGLSFGSTSSICQGILKVVIYYKNRALLKLNCYALYVCNLLHKFHYIPFLHVIYFLSTLQAVDHSTNSLHIKNHVASIIEALVLLSSCSAVTI